MKKTDQKELPKNVFVEPKSVFTNRVLCEAITDSGGTPVLEKKKYGNRIVPTLEMTPDLLKKAYNSVANLNNELTFNVYAEVNFIFQRFEILEPSSQRKAKNNRWKVVRKLKKKQQEKKGKNSVQKAPN